MSLTVYHKAIGKIASRLEHPFNLYVSGDSMEPCLKNHQKVRVVPLTIITQILIGDIIVFSKFVDHFTIHRVVEIQKKGKDEIFRTKGDNNDYVDHYIVKRDEIIGVVCLERVGKDKG